MVDAVQQVSLPLAQTQSNTGMSANMANYDAFLQLLVTQLRNQDPTKPQDSGEFLSQLASFSSVEQQIQTNRSLGSLIANASLSTAASLIGRDISYFGEPAGKVVAVSLQVGGWIAETDQGLQIPIKEGIGISKDE